MMMMIQVSTTTTTTTRRKENKKEIYNLTFFIQRDEHQNRKEMTPSVRKRSDTDKKRKKNKHE